MQQLYKNVRLRFKMEFEKLCIKYVLYNNYGKNQI